MNELDERKIKILNAIIKNYLETGEPVGSRTISKDTDLNLSSATIRNEMCDLEELGYIMQPHTSAGRIPSDKGYRFYVDHLMVEKDNQVKEMQDLVIENTQKMEQMLQHLAKVLANNTNYATMITAPQYGKKTVKFIQLSNIDNQQLLVVVVLSGNIVKNKIIPNVGNLTQEEILKLNFLLNTNLNGLSMEQINIGTLAVIKEQAGSSHKIMQDILEVVSEAISEDENLEIYTSGTTNILKYPELSDKSKASDLLNAFEEKQELAALVRENLTSEESTGIQVYIGQEAPIATMQDCSVVTATYELGEGVKGTIGIIGPKRMDYENVMENIKNLKNQLDGILNKVNIKDE